MTHWSIHRKYMVSGIYRNMGKWFVMGWMVLGLGACSTLDLFTWPLAGQSTPKVPLMTERPESEHDLVAMETTESQDNSTDLECDLEAVADSESTSNSSQSYPSRNPYDKPISEEEIGATALPNPTTPVYSDKFGFFIDGMENQDLLDAVDRWLTTPFKWGGCSDNGIDCSCLVKRIYKTVYGINLSRTSAEIFRKDLTPVDRKDLKEGDIIGFRTKGNRISHIGIYLKNGKFVHSSRSRGVIISDLSARYYKIRFVRAGRVKQVHPELLLVDRSSIGNDTSGSIQLKKLAISESASASPIAHLIERVRQ